MSLHLPSRRIALNGSAALRSLSQLPSSSATTRAAPLIHPISQVRSKWGGFWNRKSKQNDNIDRTKDLDDPKIRAKLLGQQNAELSSSLFEDEVAAVQQRPTGEAAAAAVDSEGTPMQAAPYEMTAWRLDPDPRSRARWERKKVMQMVRREGRITRAEHIARTEREVTVKSINLPTSVKKLVHLARQISGKTLDDAVVQMAFSKKKMAAEVKYHLEEARDVATVQHGMGLGAVSKPDANDGSPAPEPLEIRLKDGKTLKVEDPTRMYISQAWVGKGPTRTRRLEYRSRGRMSILVSPSTSISVILKEEKTRIREHNERQDKEARRKPWVHLPNRPVTAQRPYYSW